MPILQKSSKYDFLSILYTCEISKMENIEIIPILHKSSKYEFLSSRYSYTLAKFQISKILRLCQFYKNRQNMNFYQAYSTCKISKIERIEVMPILQNRPMNFYQAYLKNFKNRKYCIEVMPVLQKS